MKFKYYIIDTLDGVVKGTNETEVAQSLAKSEDYYVVGAEEGLWLMPDTIGEHQEITQV